MSTRCDKDFALHLQGYWVLANSTSPNTMNMEFNWLLLNGKAGPMATPLTVRQGDRVRIRFINLGMNHHPMHPSRPHLLCDWNGERPHSGDGMVAR